MASLEAAEDAKRKLSVLLREVEGVTGLGIASVQEGFGVRVNVSAPDVGNDVPQKMDGVPVVTRVTGNIRSHVMTRTF